MGLWVSGYSGEDVLTGRDIVSRLKLSELRSRYSQSNSQFQSHGEFLGRTLTECQNILKARVLIAIYETQLSGDEKGKEKEKEA